MHMHAGGLIYLAYPPSKPGKGSEQRPVMGPPTEIDRFARMVIGAQASLVQSTLTCSMIHIHWQNLQSAQEAAPRHSL